jgi:Ser/Thr protein kinase RdoA (MazF antagonist)
MCADAQATQDAELFLVKVYNAVDSRNTLLMDGLHELFTFLQSSPDVSVYQPVETLNGERYVKVMCDVVDGSQQEVVVRLLRWINGETVSSFGTSPEILFDTGKYLGKLHAALSSFDHPAFHRSHMWDIMVRACLRALFVLADTTLHSRVATFLD